MCIRVGLRERGMANSIIYCSRVGSHIDLMECVNKCPYQRGCDKLGMWVNKVVSEDEEESPEEEVCS